MLESDKREIWRYGNLQKEALGVGLVLVRLRDGGDSPQEMSYAAIETLSSWPDPVVGWIRLLTMANDGGLCIQIYHEREWRLWFMKPDLTMIDIFKTLLEQIEEKMNHEQRKTKSRRRARRTE